MDNPTIDEFKARFDRDFPFGGDSDLTRVRDQDVQNALDDAGLDFPASIFPTQAIYTKGYLLMAAHFLVSNLRNSSQGLNGSFDWLTGSKGVGSVSESFQIPQRILEHPILSMYCKTSYGAQYAQLVLPLTTGNIFTVFADANP